MGYVKGESAGQGSLFPVTLDELVPEDHPVRVIEAFVVALDLVDLGFERAQPPAMGRPAYDPADWLKLYLYLYLYLNRIRSSRRLEREEPLNREAVAAALAELRSRKADCETARAALKALDTEAHVVGEGEARLMKTAEGYAVAYNVQSAVDAKHGLIVHHEVTSEGNDQNSLEPTAKAAQQVLGGGPLTVVADAGYVNATQFAACEAACITPYVALKPGVNNQGDGTFYQPSAFVYDAGTDTYRCPANKVLVLKQVNRTELCRVYAAQEADCAGCAHKPKCTQAARRFVRRHVHADALERMAARLDAAPGMMKRRRALAEHPFGQIKCWVMGDGRLLLKGLHGARTEMALAVLARNMKRVMNILGTQNLIERLVYA